VVPLKNNEELSIGEKATYLLLQTNPNENSMIIMGCLRALNGVEEVYFASGEWSFVAKISGNSDECKKEALRVPGVKTAKIVKIEKRW